MLSTNVLCLKKRKRRTYSLANAADLAARCKTIERTAAMIQVTEDTPPDMLAGAMDLTVLLPTGKSIKMAVERSTPMMDLLVQITTNNQLHLSNYTLQALCMSPPGTSAPSVTRVLPYKPNTPIGALDTQHIKVVPKSRPFPSKSSAAAVPGPPQQPFESTFRLKVHLPRNQLYVTRVSQTVQLGDIRRKVCDEKNLDPQKYELRHPANLNEVLDSNLTLSDYQLTEVCLVPSGTLNQGFSSNDIMALRKEEERKQLHSKTGGGVFNLIFRRGKTSTGSLSSDNRSISPSQSDESRSVTPPTNGIAASPQPPSTNTAARVEAATDRPRAAHRKRRPAPKPPTTTTNQPQPQPQPQPPPPLTICHSRNSSDSSGYHEASILSDHCNTSLPRRPRSTLVSDEVSGGSRSASTSTSNLNRAKSKSASNLTFSTAAISTSRKKKNAAPPPPSPQPLQSVSKHAEGNNPSCSPVDIGIDSPSSGSAIETSTASSDTSSNLDPSPMSKNDISATATVLLASSRDSSVPSPIHHQVQQVNSIFNLPAATTNKTNTTTTTNEFCTLTPLPIANNDPATDVKASDMSSVSSALHAFDFVDDLDDDVIGDDEDDDDNATLSSVPEERDEDVTSPPLNQVVAHDNHYRRQSASDAIMHKCMRVNGCGDCTIPTQPPLCTNNLLHHFTTTTNRGKTQCCNRFQVTETAAQLDNQEIDGSPSSRVHQLDSLLDWQYQLPSPPKAFRDSSPPPPSVYANCGAGTADSVPQQLYDKLKAVSDSITVVASQFEVDSVVTSPELFEKNTTTYEHIEPPLSPLTTESDCTSVTSDFESRSPKLSTPLTLEHLEKRKSLVYNRELATSLKENHTENRSKINPASAAVTSPVAAVTASSASVAATLPSKSSLPNFKITTYHNPKQKINIFEDDTVRSNQERNTSSSTNGGVSSTLPRPGPSVRDISSTVPGISNFCNGSGNVVRSESFSMNHLQHHHQPMHAMHHQHHWTTTPTPVKPVTRSKSQLIINRRHGRERAIDELNELDKPLVKTNSLFDVSGLQSLEVMRLIQNKLDSSPAINMRTWSDRIATAKKQFSNSYNEDNKNAKNLKNVNGTVTFRINGDDTYSTNVPLLNDVRNNNNNVVIKIGGIGSTGTVDVSGTATKPILRRPLANVANRLQSTTRPHSIAIDSELDASRVPVVRSVEFKKPFRDLKNGTTVTAPPQQMLRTTATTTITSLSSVVSSPRPLLWAAEAPRSLPYGDWSPTIDPKEQLLQAIREFGGKKGLRTVQV